jgi:GT2 family glycosyltransferase
MGNDDEFTIRLERQGIKSVYLPKSLVHHRIRPDQLKTKWLCRRAFVKGRSRAWRAGHPNVPHIFGVPRYLIRELVENKIKQIFYFFKERDFIDFSIEYWITKGMIYQFRKGIQK